MPAEIQATYSQCKKKLQQAGQAEEEKKMYYVRICWYTYLRGYIKVNHERVITIFKNPLMKLFARSCMNKHGINDTFDINYRKCS